MTVYSHLGNMMRLNKSRCIKIILPHYYKARLKTILNIAKMMLLDMFEAYIIMFFLLPISLFQYTLWLSQRFALYITITKLR